MPQGWWDSCSRGRQWLFQLNLSNPFPFASEGIKPNIGQWDVRGCLLGDFKIFLSVSHTWEKISLLLWILLGEDFVCDTVLITRKKVGKNTVKWIPDRPVMFSHQWTNAATHLSVLKPWYLGCLLFSAESILTKMVVVVFYKIAEFPDNKHLVRCPLNPLISPWHGFCMKSCSMTSVWSHVLTSSMVQFWCHHLPAVCMTLGKLLNFSEPHFHSLCIIYVPHCWKSVSPPPL